MTFTSPPSSMPLGSLQPDRPTVYVVDDDDAYRHSVVRLLEFAGHQVQEFQSADEFLKAARSLEGGTALLDVRMPGTGGLELLADYPDVLERFTFIVVTGHGDIGVAVRSLKLGAVDFLEKPFDPAALLNMIESTAGTANVLAKDRLRERAARHRIESLSRREQEVLRGMLGGGSNKVIARHLKISDRTVEMHRAHLLHKLGTATSAEAVQLATFARLEPAWRPRDADLQGS